MVPAALQTLVNAEDNSVPLSMVLAVLQTLVNAEDRSALLPMVPAALQTLVDAEDNSVPLPMVLAVLQALVDAGGKSALLPMVSEQSAMQSQGLPVPPGGWIVVIASNRPGLSPGKMRVLDTQNRLSGKMMSPGVTLAIHQPLNGVVHLQDSPVVYALDTSNLLPVQLMVFAVQQGYLFPSVAW